MGLVLLAIALTEPFLGLVSQTLRLVPAIHSIGFLFIISSVGATTCFLSLLACLDFRLAETIQDRLLTNVELAANRRVRTTVRFVGLLLTMLAAVVGMMCINNFASQLALPAPQMAVDRIWSYPFYIFAGCAVVLRFLTQNLPEIWEPTKAMDELPPEGV